MVVPFSGKGVSGVAWERARGERLRSSSNITVSLKYYVRQRVAFSPFTHNYTERMRAEQISKWDS